jgi:hypothetical protein
LRHPWSERFPSEIATTARSDAAGAAVVDLPIPVERVTRPMSSVPTLRHLTDGSLLVNDDVRHQLRLFGADLATSTVLLDSVPLATASYASRAVRGNKRLIPFRGDSSLFGPDGPPEESMLVLDGRGRAVRSFPMGTLGQPPGFTDERIFFDPRGRLIYRHSDTMHVRPSTVEVPMPSRRADGVSPFGGRGAAATTMRVFVGRADSLPIVRVDFATRAIDTLDHIMLPANDRPGINGVGNGGGKLVAVFGTDGKPSAAKQIINPLVAVDDWAVLSDGTIAVVRGSDYHVDWIHPDGRRSASPKLPFAWQRLTDADKQRLVDSTRAAVDSLDALADAIATARPARRIDGGPVLRQWPYEIVALSRIADFYPPVRPGATKPDADGNLWILPTTSESRNGALVYDVVHPTRGLVRRVRLPAGRSIAGFGAGGIVYLAVGDPANGFVVERTTVPGLAPR